MAAISTLEAKFARIHPKPENVFLWNGCPDPLKASIMAEISFEDGEIGVFGYADGPSQFLLVTNRRIVVADRMLNCSVSLVDLTGIGLMEKAGEEQACKHITLDARSCTISVGVRADAWHVVFSILKFVVMSKGLTVD